MPSSKPDSLLKSRLEWGYLFSFFRSYIIFPILYFFPVFIFFLLLLQKIKIDIVIASLISKENLLLG
jgi:hypothetical protein